MMSQKGITFMIFVLMLTFLNTVKDSMFVSNSVGMTKILGWMVLMLFFNAFLTGAMMNSSLSKKEAISLSFITIACNIFITINFMSINLVLYFYTIEMCVFPMYIYVYFYSKEEKSAMAATSMILFGILGSVPFMSVVTNILNPVLENSWNMSFSLLSMLFFSVLLITKFPLFMFHFWLTKAHVSAMTFCSMILASLTLKMASFGVFKFINFWDTFFEMSNYLICFSLMGMVLFCSVMIRSMDTKYLIACSSVVHMGFLYPLMLFKKGLAFFSACKLMISHGYISSMMFYMVGLNYETLKSRSFIDIKSSSNTMVFLFAILMILSLMNMGIPPFFNFYAELYVTSVLLEYSILTIIFMSVYLMLSMIFSINFFLKLQTSEKKELKVVNSEDLKIVLNMTLFIFLMLISPLCMCFNSLGKRYFVEVKINSAMKMIKVSVLFSTFLMIISLCWMSSYKSLQLSLSTSELSSIFYMNSFTLEFYFLSFTFLMMLTLVSTMVLRYSKFYMEEYQMLKFCLILFMFILSMTTLCLSTSIYLILLGWDLLGVSSVLLIFFYPNKTSITNGMLTMYMNRLSDICMIMCASFMLSSLNMDFQEVPTDMTFFILLAFCICTKSAQIPLSSWLPAAMSAPTPISALVHSSTLVTAGLYLMYKIGGTSENWEQILTSLSYLGIFSYLLSGALALMETDLKKMVAYSTMGQISVCLFIGTSMFQEWSQTHMIHHAIFKSLMFCACGSLFIISYSNQQSKFLFPEKNMMMKSILIASGFHLSALCLSLSFYTKDFILELCSSHSSKVLWIFLLLGGSLTCLYTRNIMLISEKLGSLNLWKSIKNMNFRQTSIMILTMSGIMLSQLILNMSCDKMTAFALYSELVIYTAIMVTPSMLQIKLKKMDFSNLTFFMKSTMYTILGDSSKLGFSLSYTDNFFVNLRIPPMSTQKVNLNQNMSMKNLGILFLLILMLL